MRTSGGLASIRLGKGMRLAVAWSWRWFSINFDGGDVVLLFDVGLSMGFKQRHLLVLLACPAVALVSRHLEHLYAEDEHELEWHSKNIKHCHHVLDVSWSHGV